MAKGTADRRGATPGPPSQGNDDNSGSDTVSPTHGSRKRSFWPKMPPARRKRRGRHTVGETSDQKPDTEQEPDFRCQPQELESQPSQSKSLDESDEVMHHHPVALVRGPMYFLGVGEQGIAKLPAELVAAVAGLLDVSSMKMLALASPKFSQIVMPILWAKVRLDLTRRVQTLMEPTRLIVGSSTLAVLRNVVERTRSLELILPPSPEADCSALHKLLYLLQYSSIGHLQFSESQLKKESWQILDTLLNDQSGNRFQEYISELPFPKLKPWTFINGNIYRCQESPRGWSLKFPSKGRGRHREISVSIWDGNTETAPTYRTDVVRTVLKGAGASDTFKRLLICDNTPLQGYHQGLLPTLGLSQAGTLANITILEFINISLASGGFNADVELLRLPALKPLRLISCEHITVLFRKLMEAPEQSSLRNFQLVYHKKSLNVYHPKGSYNLEGFLTSCSSLQNLNISIADNWPIDIESVLTNQANLQNLRIRIGMRDFPVEILPSIHGSCQKLQRFDFAYSPALVPIKTDNVTFELRRLFGKVAADLARFPSLTEIRLLMLPVGLGSLGKLDDVGCPLKFTANWIHNMLYDHNASTIKNIALDLLHPIQRHGTRPRGILRVYPRSELHRPA